MRGKNQIIPKSTVPSNAPTGPYQDEAAASSVFSHFSLFITEFFSQNKVFKKSLARPPALPRLISDPGYRPDLYCLE